VFTEVVYTINLLACLAFRCGRYCHDTLKHKGQTVDGSLVTLLISKDDRVLAQLGKTIDQAGRRRVTSQRLTSKQLLRPSVVMVARKQKGGSQSRLVLCDDRKLYVLKTHPNPQGPNVLANEALGSILLSGLGFTVPAWRPITISLQALHCFPELTMETANGFILPACGVHFGSEYVGGPQYDLFDLIPESYRIRNSEQVAAISLFDLWANHHDNRQCVYRRPKKTGDYEALFIDNGHLFGGPEWSDDTGLSLKLWTRYLRTLPVPAKLAMQRWMTMFETTIPGLLHEATAVIPREWYKGDIGSLCARLIERLKCLRAIADLEPVAESRES
jgi:hypothetical protein